VDVAIVRLTDALEKAPMRSKCTQTLCPFPQAIEIAAQATALRDLVRIGQGLGIVHVLALIERDDLVHAANAELFPLRLGDHDEA
jgi:hypothetical protein